MDVYGYLISDILSHGKTMEMMPHSTLQCLNIKWSSEQVSFHFEEMNKLFITPSAI